MRWFVQTLVLHVFLLGQQPKATVARELPPDRIDDTYSVYDAALRNSLIGDHTGDPPAYFIADRTGQRYGVGDPDKCMDAPEDDREAFEQAADDFRAQNGSVYRIVNRFNLNGRKVRLLNRDEEKHLQDWLFNGKNRPEPSLAEATDIIRLSRVGFSSDRSLAIVVVSNYCGGLCGSERWRIFKRSNDRWVEQRWNKCFILS